MGQYSVGFVYILENETMPGMIKIGQTSRLAEDRAAEMSGTNVALPFKVLFRALTSHATVLEKAVHHALADRRVYPGREFFRVTATEAIETILRLRQQVDGIAGWVQEAPTRAPILLRAGDRLLLSLRAGQLFIQYAYSGPVHDETNIEDVWQAHTDGDTLELYFTDTPDYTTAFSEQEPFSADDPIPYLNRTGTAANDTVIGQERLVPGDRLIWMDDTVEGSFQGLLLEAAGFGQVIARSRVPQLINSEPLLINIVTRERFSDAIVLMAEMAFRLPAPRSWAPRHPNPLEGWEAVTRKKAPPDYWLTQLGIRKTGRK